MSAFQKEVNANIEAIRKNVEAEIQKQSRFVSFLKDRVSSLQGATKQLASACASLSSKGVNEVVETTVQATVKQSIVPRVDAVVEEMKEEVMGFVKEWSANSELAEVKATVEEMKEEVARLRQTLAAGGGRGSAELTEGEVEAMISEGLVKQLILRVSEESDQRIVMYACGKLFGPGAQLEEVESGILMGLVYRVGEAAGSEA